MGFVDMAQDSASLFSRLTQVVLRAVDKLQNQVFLFGIAITVLIIILLLLGQHVRPELIPLAYALLFLDVVAVLLVIFKPQPDTAPASSPTDGQILVTVFPHSNGLDFKRPAQDKILHAKKVVLMGTGLNILSEPIFIRTLMRHAASTEGYDLEIYMADPRSPLIEARLIEEELGQERPQIGDRGILKRFHDLLENWKRLNCPKQIKIRMFTHYPTFALLMIDREYFIYPYGMSTLGDFSPVLRFSADDPKSRAITSFLEHQYEFLSRHALDAKQVFAIRNREPVKAEELRAFAVYFVPPADSRLYQFGTGVLSYDVRNQSRENSRWQREIGDAATFGFHLTISDALYFASDAHIAIVAEHVKYVAERLHPFDLVKLRIKRGFPDEHSISIAADDPSGCLEFLHHELVQRVNRRALGSNYSLGITKPVRDADFERAELMIDHYQAPYIMGRYQPHFTLLTSVPAEKQVSTAAELDLALGNAVRDRKIRVDKLALMTKPTGRDHWVIEKEISLG